MEIKPPCVCVRDISVPASYRGASSGPAKTYDVVVGAADGVGRARVASADTDDGDRRAVEPDEPSNVPEDNPEQTQEKRSRRRVRLKRAWEVQGEWGVR